MRQTETNMHFSLWGKPWTAKWGLTSRKSLSLFSERLPYIINTHLDFDSYDQIWPVRACVCVSSPRRERGAVHSGPGEVWRKLRVQRRSWSGFSFPQVLRLHQGAHSALQKPGESVYVCLGGGWNPLGQRKISILSLIFYIPLSLCVCSLTHTHTHIEHKSPAGA